MKTMLPMLMPLLAAACFAQDAATPAPAPEVVTIQTIVSYPRSVDTMARLWMTLYQACQTAGVPAQQILTRSNSVFGPEMAQAIGTKKDHRDESILLQVQPQAMASVATALLPAAGKPTAVFQMRNPGTTKVAVYIAWVWAGPWGNTPTDPGLTLGGSGGRMPDRLVLVLASDMRDVPPDLQRMLDNAQGQR